MSNYGYKNLSPEAKRLLNNAAGTVVVPVGALLDGRGMAMHLRTGVFETRCGLRFDSVVMHIRHAERIAASCQKCWR